jgi:GntR family transcriptional regulator
VPGRLGERIAEELRGAIRGAKLRPGDRLPTEAELRVRYGVAPGTVRAAVAQLAAEGLVLTRQGRGVYVREQAVPRRLSTDITTSLGWYTTLQRQGLTPQGKTTVRREKASDIAAEWLGIAPGTRIVIRERDLGMEGEAPIMVATSHFPDWVVDQAPNLANPKIGGMPEHLRNAFGETYSNDVLTTRMPSPQEAERLQLPPGTPVLVIFGGTYDQQHRPLHFIEVIAAGGRIEFAYQYGTVPEQG